MPRPIHFEIQAADPKRAIAFYSALFGWVVQQMGRSTGLLADQDGREGTRWASMAACSRDEDRRRCRCRRSMPMSAPIRRRQSRCHVEKVGELGTMVVVPKMAVPGVGWLAYATDTEGNIFGMLQPDAAAK